MPCLHRVLKPGEERLAAFYLRLQPDALLVRSTGMLHSLNAMTAQGVSQAFSSPLLASNCKSLLHPLQRLQLLAPDLDSME